MSPELSVAYWKGNVGCKSDHVWFVNTCARIRDVTVITLPMYWNILDRGREILMEHPSTAFYLRRQPGKRGSKKTNRFWSNHSSARLRWSVSMLIVAKDEDK